MEHFIWVLLISVYSYAYSSAYSTAYTSAYSNTYAPSKWMVQQRRSPPPAYTSDFLNEYEPYAYAAIPIHSPMPLLHVITPSNLPKYRPKKYIRPQVQKEQYVHSSSAEESAEYSQEEYSDSITRPKYTSYYEDDIPVLVYGRPNKKTHRRPLTVTTPSTSLVQSPQEPFVIRIHKYRLVKD